METFLFSLNRRVITFVLGAMAFFLALASICGQFSKFLLGHGYLKGLVPLFDLGSENNIPTFFSMLLLLFAALLLAVITALKNTQKMPDVSKWAILSCGFLFMAYDEAFTVHETLLKPARGLLNRETYGLFYFTWVIFGIILVFILGLFFLRFLLHLPSVTQRAFIIAEAIYLGGVIGAEMIGGAYAEIHGLENLTYKMISTSEECLEMAGLIVFLYALLGYIADNFREVSFRVV